MDSLVMQKLDLKDTLRVPIESINDFLIITSDKTASCRELDLDKAREFNESPFQLLEGNFYDFEFESTTRHTLSCSFQNVVVPHSKKPFRGRIIPNIFVGTLTIAILEIETKKETQKIILEVLATKFDNEIDQSYRESYRLMLEEITDKATDILFQINSPVQQSITFDYDQNYRTLYQRFSFIQSLVNNEDFENAIFQIEKNPTVKWNSINEEITSTSIKRINRNVVQQLVSKSNRIRINNELSRTIKLEFLPAKISTSQKVESIDTNENQFIKHVLLVFSQFTNDCYNAFKMANYNQQASEAKIITQKLEGYMYRNFFKEISPIKGLHLNSPMLQRKAGYREVLKRWLQFDLAAKLIWSGGDDVYSAGKKDIAKLYEYWLFFKLLNLFQKHFSIEKNELSKLIVITKDNLSLQLKEGIETALSGSFVSKGRHMQMKFCYNREFKKSAYPNSGSWTINLNPDYTLSIWPEGITETQAEIEELIVHIHFDAKYKVEHFFETVNSTDSDIQREKKARYKNIDIWKMHTYKDAIRRTGGAYILYPGDKSKKEIGFHEIIPGLGAFTVRPSKVNDGTDELRAFISDIIEHFADRTSQREKLAYRTFDIHKNIPDLKYVQSEFQPESSGENRDFFADEATVLIGYYRSPEHLKWIVENGIYNFRINSKNGNLSLTKDTLNARYILLHTDGEKSTSHLFKINVQEFVIKTKSDLKKLNYPTEPSQELYLTIAINLEIENELKDQTWIFTNLDYYKKGRLSALPFTVLFKDFQKIRVI